MKHAITDLEALRQQLTTLLSSPDPIVAKDAATALKMAEVYAGSTSMLEIMERFNGLKVLPAILLSMVPAIDPSFHRHWLLKLYADLSYLYGVNRIPTDTLIEYIELSITDG